MTATETRPAEAHHGAGSPTPEATGERVTAAFARPYRPYESRSSATPDAASWVQIDLGTPRSFEAVRLYPAHRMLRPGNGFPLRFRIEGADEPTFGAPRVLVDRTTTDYPDPADSVVEFPVRARARHVRLTATRLRQQKKPDIPFEIGDQSADVHLLSLSKVEILSDGSDIALHRPVRVDPDLGIAEDAAQLTRSSRPQGECLVTDDPGNVTDPAAWQPPTAGAWTPADGVTLHGGAFERAMRTNIRYLLDSFTADDLLRPFRERAGGPLPPSDRVPNPFWETELAGSNAGRFLMGAGTTLRWMEDPALRARLSEVVDGIAACREPDGYLMAYPADTIFFSERGAYTRSWVTQGLLEAGNAGRGDAFDLLRGYYDWYNRQPFLRELLRGCGQGGQGMVANSGVHLSPAGTPADVHVLQRYFQENFWLEDLAQRRPEAVFEYPYDRPHAYLLTNVLAYLDLYRATGEERYLAAVDGARDLFRDHWESAGGAISIIEAEYCPPGSDKLYGHQGETCGSAFWALLNQRLHHLRPDEEHYVTEVEKSLHNVLLANQTSDGGIRYHTRLVGRKGRATRENTCCEGQGTRLLGSLPEFVYSVSDDGLWVNLFEPSSIRWQRDGDELVLTQRTEFPRRTAVRLEVSTSAPLEATIRVRVPSWAAAPMAVRVNGAPAAVGTAGSFVPLHRSWVSGDVVEFDLPAGLRMTRYRGADRVPGRERFAVEYGPFLLAALDAAEESILLIGAESPGELVDRLVPDEDDGSRFTLPANMYREPIRWIPYRDVTDEWFSCFPYVEARLDLF